jgi:2-isopropylmalate synthase
VKSFPELKKVHLTDYKVRIIDTEVGDFLKELKKDSVEEVVGAIDSTREKISGTAAKTRVLIESSDGKREWGTVGVSENIIEASLQALVDSMEYALLRK